MVRIVLYGCSTKDNFLGVFLMGYAFEQTWLGLCSESVIFQNRIATFCFKINKRSRNLARKKTRIVTLHAQNEQEQQCAFSKSFVLVFKWKKHIVE